MNNRIPGRIVGDRLVKRVTRSRHFLRWLQGYAWSLEQIERAKAQGVRVLELLEDSGRVLRVGLDYVLEHGKRFQFDIYEKQVGIPEAAMTVYDKMQPELFGRLA
jgi:hypothetical protein